MDYLWLEYVVFFYDVQRMSERTVQFSGHAVIPSLVRDMEDPSEFDKMITWAFVGLINILL